MSDIFFRYILAIKLTATLKNREICGTLFLFLPQKREIVDVCLGNLQGKIERERRRETELQQFPEKDQRKEQSGNVSISLSLEKDVLLYYSDAL